MSDNKLKIDVVIADVGESGAVLSDFVTQDLHNTDMAKKADLVNGKVNPTQLPEFSELSGVTDVFSQLENNLRENINISLAESKEYADSIVSEVMSKKADLVNGRVPKEQATNFKDIPGAKAAIDGLKQSLGQEIIGINDSLENNFAKLTNGKVSQTVLPTDLVYLDRLTREMNDVRSALQNTITPESPFFGKKIGAIGDSITWGFTPRNDPNGGTTGAQLSSWLVLAAQKLGMTAFNYGISGSTLGANSAGANDPFSRRYQNMANDLDVICVMGGTNDVRKGVPIGTMSDRVDTTYYGALHVICQGLIDKYYVNQGTELGKSKQIILMTPIKLQVVGGTALDTAIEPYVQAVKDVGAYYSIPVLDMYNLSGITPHISQTIQGTETGYTKTYNVYITDGTHPTQQGHEKMAAAFSGFLKTLK